MQFTAGRNSEFKKLLEKAKERATTEKPETINEYKEANVNDFK